MDDDREFLEFVGKARRLNRKAHYIDYEHKVSGFLAAITGRMPQRVADGLVFLVEHIRSDHPTSVADALMRIEENAAKSIPNDDLVGDEEPKGNEGGEKQLK